jgi:hypothetical protein
MKAESKFLKQPLEFWANVKLISQKIGYTERGTSQVKVPTFEVIQSVYKSLDLDSSKIIDSKGTPTTFGSLLIEYFQHRATFLNYGVEPNLMNAAEAKALFNKLKKELKPKSPIPMNKQSGAKKSPAYFTGIINMLIEAHSKGYDCDYNPMELTAFTKDNFPIRSLSRRIDGCFPEVINPIAIWEIKEYYYTTTFGSRIADGVYETLLDGYELVEAREAIGRNVHHYLMVDAYDTWWKKGRSYLCRICDMLHMGLLDEALFGKEVVERLPEIVKEWTKEADKKTARPKSGKKGSV